MKRASPWLGVLLALLAGAGRAEEPHSGPSDVPAGPASIRGFVVHAARPEVVEGVSVLLHALSASGTPGMRGTRADARGEFSFEGLSNDPDTVYLISTEYLDVQFGARVRFAEGEREQRVELRISDSTPDASGVVVGESRIRIDRGCAHVRVDESLELRNPTDRVVWVPEAARAQHPPILSAVLPDGLRQLEASPEGLLEGFEQDGATIRFWGPLHPGTRELAFRYWLPAADGPVELRRGYPSGAERVVVLTPENGPAVGAGALHPGAPASLDGHRYRTLEADGLAPGAAVELSFELPPAGDEANALGLTRTRMFLELDDAALSVEEEHQLAVSGEAPLAATSGAPLLCLPLPQGAEALRVGPASLTAGVWLDPSGALAVRGPFPPGKSALAVGYRIPVASDSVVLERRFARALPLLSVFVTDTGVVAETDRLHRRRPIRTSDRSHLHLEAFEIGDGEPIALRLTRLPARRPLPPFAAMGFVALAAAATLGLLAAPLRSPGAESKAEESPASRAAAERESIYAAIQDLDHDYETGKLVEEDHARIRAELRGRAVALLHEERQARLAEARRSHTPEAESSPEQARDGRRCPRCDAPSQDEARFCSQCGARLTAEQGSREGPAR